MNQQLRVTVSVSAPVFHMCKDRRVKYEIKLEMEYQATKQQIKVFKITHLDKKRRNKVVFAFLNISCNRSTHTLKTNFFLLYQ